VRPANCSVHLKAWRRGRTAFAVAGVNEDVLLEAMIDKELTCHWFVPRCDQGVDGPSLIWREFEI
jgi:hypothetical protein